MFCCGLQLIPQGVVLKDDIQKEERSEINDLMFHFEKLEKEEWIKFKCNQKKGINKDGGSSRWNKKQKKKNQKIDERKGGSLRKLTNW